MCLVRMLGAAMLSAAVVLAGVLAARRQKMRLRQLSQCVELIRFIAVEIRYGCAPVSDMLFGAAHNEAFGALEFLPKVETDAACDFAAAWRQAVEAAASLALKREEKAILLRFGESLGTTDSQTQLLLCERFAAQMKKQLDEADARRAESLRLTLGGAIVSALILFALIL